MSDAEILQAVGLSTREIVTLILKSHGKRITFSLGIGDETAFISRVRVDCSRCREAYRKQQKQNPKLKMRQFRLKAETHRDDIKGIMLVTFWTGQSEGNQFDEVLEDMGLKNAEEMVNG